MRLLLVMFLLFVHRAADAVETLEDHFTFVVPNTFDDADERFSEVPLFLPDVPGLADIVHDAGNAWGIDPRLLYAVIKVESNGNPNARSPKGAEGLMQLIPDTARLMEVRNSFDPRENVWGGSGYLRKLLDRFGSFERALAAYYAGPERVEGHRMSELPAETIAYVDKVLRYYAMYCASGIPPAFQVVRRENEVGGYPSSPPPPSPYRTRFAPPPDLILNDRVASP